MKSGLHMALQVTARDRLLLQALAHRVRLLSVAQAARAFWPAARDPIENARRRLAELEAAGLIEHLTIMAHPELDLVRPVVIWKLADPAPDWGAVAHRLKARWTRAAQPTRVILPTPACLNWLGGEGGRHPRLSEATHDLHLATVYLNILRDTPRRARHWASEAQLLREGAGRNEKLPDAIIRSTEETTAIEFGGAYSKRKLTEFHAHCARRGLSYEVW